MMNMKNMMKTIGTNAPIQVKDMTPGITTKIQTAKTIKASQLTQSIHQMQE